jgi:hypothetical protein
LGKRIDVRRSGFAAIGAKIGKAGIIDDNDDEVRPRRGLRLGWRVCAEQCDGARRRQCRELAERLHGASPHHR